jgi:ribonucleotide reductase class II
MSALQELQNYTFVSKYARWLEDKNRRETWKEAVERVRSMMHNKYDQFGIAEDIDWAYDMMHKKKVLGSQRALQFGGDPIVKRHAKIYNCTSSYCDRLRFFQECFWLLLCGSGTGFSVQKHHVAKLPTLEHNVERGEGTKYVIEDSIEGWADALGVLLSSYFSKPIEEFKHYKNTYVVFDYSNIRPKGASLASGVGKAPGFEPLQNGLEKIRALLDRCIANGQKKLRPIDAYDIVMHSSDAVLSGGVRRSASLALFSPDDDEMAKAKTGNWYMDNPQRARSNNSALLLKNETTFEEFQTLMESVKEFGEPGFIWSDSTEMTFNPCVVADSTVVTDRGIKMVEDLINKPFNAIVDGISYPSYKGFWKTGTKQVIELQLKSGRNLRVTPNHKIMTTTGWKEAGDINFGESVVINNHRPYPLDNIANFNPKSSDWKKAYLLGLFLGDGNHSRSSAQLKWWGESKDQYRKEAYEMLSDVGFANSHNKSEQNAVAVYSSIESKGLMQFALDHDCMVGTSKRLGKKSVCGSWNHISGLIAGYFDADGTVLVNNIKGSSLRISSVQLQNLQNLQIALNALGIYSKIYKNRRPEGDRSMPDGRGGTKNYFCQASHELVISSDNITRFAKYVPIRNEQKLEKLNSIVKNYQRMPNRTNFVDTLVNKTIIGDLDVYDCTVEDIHAFDNDGVYVHNCVEVGMWPIDESTGKSGWQGCNLSTINCSSIEDEDDFYDRCKAAAIIGTLQAGFTKLDYLGEVSRRIFEREALLGVSLTGIMEKHDLVLSEKVLKAGAKVALETNKEMSKKIGINQAARVTCLKPEGTSSSMLGTSSGIHPHHAKRYIRHVQANILEAPYQHFKKLNPQACEKSSWSANNTDEVIKFPIEVPDGAKLKNQLPAVDMLSIVKDTQKNWVYSGKNKGLCTQQYLSHNVSNTVTVKPEEWEKVARYIYDNRKYFAGISLIPQSGDKDYPQAPFTTVYTSREIVKEYGDAALWCSGLIELGLNAFNNNLWAACDYVTLNQAHKDHHESKLKFVTKMKNFAGKYFDGDIKRLTYCMKDVYNWKIYCDLFDSFKKVDYTQLSETEDNTAGIEEISCAGGACLI